MQVFSKNPLVRSKVLLKKNLDGITMGASNEGVLFTIAIMRHLDHLKNLVIMASADGSLSEREIALLVDRCSELGLAESDLGKAVEFALSDEASLKLPTDRAEQMEMLADLIRIMAADGELSEVEKRLFALAAAKMNVDRKELDKMIDKLLGKYGQ